MTPCRLDFTTIVYDTFGSSVATMIACACHYLQYEICAIEQGKARYVYYDYSHVLGHNCCSCYKNYSLARNSSVLQGILALCLSYLNPYCMGRITAFFQWVFKFTSYDKSALERLEGQATFKFQTFWSIRGGKGLMGPLLKTRHLDPGEAL
jgi:hypothetical protein